MPIILIQNEKSKINMKNVLRSILGNLGYQIIRSNSYKKSKVTNLLTYYETDTGNYYLPSHAYNDIIKNHIVNNLVFEKEIIDIAREYIKPNTIVLDIGANFGQMSIIFSNLVGKNGLVYSFEADNFIYNILNKNILANQKNNIFPFFGAVHDLENQILIYPIHNFEKYQTYGSYGIDYNAIKGREVNSITIDSLNIKEQISFIKIDIQGGDLKAMQGAINTILKNQCPIIFEYEYSLESEININFQEYVDFINSINYKFYRVINGQNFLIIPK